MGPGMRAGGDRAEDCGARADSGAVPVQKALLPSLRFLNSVEQVTRNPGRAAELDLDLGNNTGTPFYICVGAQLLLDPKSGHLLGLEGKHVPTWSCILKCLAGFLGRWLERVALICVLWFPDAHFPSKTDRLSPWVVSVLVFFNPLLLTQPL